MWNRGGGSETHAGRAGVSGESTLRVSGPSFSFLEFAGRIGRAGAAFLIASSLAFLIARLFYYTTSTVPFDPSEPSAATRVLLSDPYRMYAIGDLFVLVGAVLLTGTVFLILLDQRTRSSGARWVVIPLGVAALVGMAAWSLATVHAQGGSRGGSAVSAVAAAGGWSVAAGALLVASLLFVALVWALEGRGGQAGRASVRWPVFAAFNLIGAGAFVTLVRSERTDPTLATIAFALEIVLLPLLGIVTYADLWDSFEGWLTPKRREASQLEAPPLHLGVGALAAAEEPPILAGDVPPPPPDD